MINEGNKQDEYLEKRGERPKDTAMRKASSRRHRFDTGTTHQNAERENITWTRPGTRSYGDSLDRQRKSAHRSERKIKKPQAGSSPEDRRWAKFSGDEPEGKYQKLQKQKKAGQRTNIEAQKQGLIRKGERRRELRTQAVNAIRRAVGGGYVSEAKTFEQFMWSIYESTGMTPENSRTWRRLVQQHGDRPFTNPKKSNTKSASRREEESTSPPKRKRRRLDFVVREDFVPLTPEKEERVKKRVGELARDIQLQGARMKELKKKPFGRFRPKVKQEKEAITKSAKKKAKQVRSASDALIDASTSRSAKIQKRIEDLKGES